MRIIAGTARGTRLNSLDVPHLRPMLDRVKEALFSIVARRVEGARVLDAFSGSGALGLEAVSRGAAACVFIERDAQLRHLLRSNIERCHMAERSTVLERDFFSLPLYPLPRGLDPVGVAFLDPPYSVVNDPNGRAELFETVDELMGRWIDARGLVVLHHEPMPHVLWPSRRLECVDQRVYGRSQITLFEGREGEEGAGGE